MLSFQIIYCDTCNYYIIDVIFEDDAQFYNFIKNESVSECISFILLVMKIININVI